MGNILTIGSDEEQHDENALRDLQFVDCFDEQVLDEIVKTDRSNIVVPNIGLESRSSWRIKGLNSIFVPEENVLQTVDRYSVT